MLTQPDERSSAVPAPFELGVIKDARRRRRRRWIAVLAAVLVAGVVAVIVGSGGGVRSARPVSPRSGPRGGVVESPAAAFEQDPFMGVACHVPNSISCDRVGLAVWLRRPATVTAMIAGAPLKLNAPHWTYVAHDKRGALYVYAGFLQTAGLTTRLHVTPESKWTNSWLGANAPSPLVRFRIDYGHGHVVVTQEHVYLSAGWG
ncbi:MAG: hypothetical protein ACRDL8_00040 [Solirubrobacteraceae bacterium]